MGRFLNADDTDYLNASGTTLGCNLYAYCENNGVNASDPEGNDAILLLSKKKIGHIGLVFQNYGNWYYWYWGANLKDLALKYAVKYVLLNVNPFTNKYMLTNIYKTLSKNVKANAVLRFIARNKGISINTSLSSLKSKTGFYDFSDAIYLKGSFDKAFQYFMGLIDKKTPYNLLSLNCMQTSLRGLLRGEFKTNDFSSKSIINMAIRLITPISAYNFLLKNLKCGYIVMR